MDGVLEVVGANASRKVLLGTLWLPTANRPLGTVGQGLPQILVGGIV